MEHDFGVQDYNQELCQVICARDLESYVRKPWRFANGVEILTPIPTSQLIQAGAYPLCLEGSASDFVGRSGGSFTAVSAKVELRRRNFQDQHGLVVSLWSVGHKFIDVMESVVDQHPNRSIGGLYTDSCQSVFA